MIFIITGKQGEGKTSWVMDLWRLLSKEFIQVGGICSEGFWKDGIRDHFHVIDFENGYSSLLCDRKDTGSDMPFRHFFFKSEGLDFGQNALNKSAFTHPDVLIIDEVGGFELENHGWSPFLDKLKESSFRTVVMVVRESLVEQVIHQWKLDDCQMIRISDRSPAQLLHLIKHSLEIDFDQRVMPVTGIILAGGKSSRLGLDKGLLRFRDKLLINIAIERFQGLCRDIMISANTDAYQSLGYPVIPDNVKDCGPMMGLYSCLKHSSTDVNLVASVDTPLIPRGLYHELIRMRADEQVIVPDHGRERYEPLIGLYTRDLPVTMERQFERGNFTLPVLFRQIRFKGLRVGDHQPFSNPLIFTNINTYDDLAFLDHLDSLPEESRSWKL